MIRVGVDVFGGDNAPQAVIDGAILALERIGADNRIVLFGDRDTIVEALVARGCTADSFDIVHAPQRIEMGDHPAESFRQKSESSIVVGFEYLASGAIDAFAGAGATGAMMVGSMMVAKPLQGVLRPTIAISIPTIAGSTVTILDIGINVDCKPEVLEQYAVIGSVYASGVLGIDNPRVALLNIGEESSKGNAQAKAVYQLMGSSAEQGRYNFVGNIVIKGAEGLCAINKSLGLEAEFWEGLNYEQTGGTTVLGIGKVVTIGHGKSTPKAVRNMILSAQHSVKTDLVGKLKAQF